MERERQTFLLSLLYCVWIMASKVLDPIKFCLLLAEVLKAEPETIQP